MTQDVLVFLLFASLSIYPMVSSRPASAAQSAAVSEAINHDLSRGSGTRSAPADKPVITIAGLCGQPLSMKATASNCKTVISRSQFEKMIDAIEPGMPARGRREFAERYADALVMARKAEQMGLDKGATYEEQMKLARIQILNQDLKNLIQKKAEQISDRDIEDYYRNNTARFEKAQVDRIFVPKTQRSPLSSNVKVSDADRQRCLQASEQAMKDEADSLYQRAVVGEQFTDLQADAYRVAGIKSTAPTTSMLIRRVSLPPGQVSIMNLKSGELSPVMADPNGYVIYRVKTKDLLPLDEVREEIKEILRSQRLQDEVRDIEDSATPSLDESYFVR